MWISYLNFQVFVSFTILKNFKIGKYGSLKDNFMGMIASLFALSLPEISKVLRLGLPSNIKIEPRTLVSRLGMNANDCDELWPNQRP